MMDYRRESDQSFFDKIRNGLLRVRTELTLIIILTVAVFFIPPEAKAGLLALFITKAMFLTMGVLYAHASRKFLFPFLDLQKLIDEHCWDGVLFVAVYYGVIIWAFAAGG